MTIGYDDVGIYDEPGYTYDGEQFGGHGKRTGSGLVHGGERQVHPAEHTLTRGNEKR